MSQFRTVADIADEVLQKSGEPTNGNSSYEDLVITYLNKVQQAIVGGGNIFSIAVDEPWTWARAKNPITFDLLPAYTFGTISVVQGENAIVFSDAPSISLQGWFLQFRGSRTVYRITEHAASATTATLDSTFIDGSGARTFKAFKLDYTIKPSFIHVDATCDRLDFRESTVNLDDPDNPITTFHDFTATLTHGSYTPESLLDHVIDRMTALGNCTYSRNYDPDTRFSTLTSNLAGGSIFSMLGATGTNRRRSVLPLLGYDQLDFTGQDSYSSTFMPSGVSRLIEPFKVFGVGAGYPHIKSDDSIKMEEQFPLGHTREAIPIRFTKIHEDNLGNITVRFNSYPSKVIKLSIDWIPVPIDLQDNDASVPVIPRKDIDALIHGASMFILFDKEDTKWEAMLDLTRAALEAMQKKNRSELFRTGENFGTIVTRPDYDINRKFQNYGYVSDGSTGGSGGGGGGGVAPAPVMIHSQINYPSFASGTDEHAVIARITPAGKAIQSIIIKHNTKFEGLGVTQIFVSVGIPGEPDKFISLFDVGQDVTNAANAASLTVYYPVTAQNIIVTAKAIGNNLNALTQGSLDIYIQEQTVHA